MPKIKLNLSKNNEAVAEAEAKRIRELENDIQEQNQLRQQRIKQMHQKQKIMKISIISVFALVMIIFISILLYCAVFKKTISEQEVINYAYMYSQEFPKSGVEGYLRNNIDDLLAQYMMTNSNEFKSKYSSAYANKDTLCIVRTDEISSTNIRVWFTCEISVVEKDTPVDEATQRKLLESGFGIQPTPEPTPTPTPEPTPTPVPETSAVDTVVPPEETSAPAETPADAQTDFRDDETQPTDGETTEPTETTDNGSLGSLEVTDRSGQVTEYYINSSGTIMQKGKTTTELYTFYIPLEIFYVYDNNVKVCAGMQPTASLSLYSLVPVDVVDFSYIAPNKYWEFTAAPVDQTTKDAAQIKVDKILGDLYSGRDTSQDFFNMQVFNTYGASYGGISKFEMYTETNYMGYNTYVEYNITLPQGFTFEMNVYMLVEKDGNTWIITAIT